MDVSQRRTGFITQPSTNAHTPTAQLYNALYDHVQDLENVAELTVEDPSEAFEDLRDRCDLVRLRDQLKDAKELKGGSPIDRQWLEKTRREGKYAKVGSSAKFRTNALESIPTERTTLCNSGNSYG
jgi:histone acetyltransferase 1